MLIVIPILLITLIIAFVGVYILLGQQASYYEEPQGTDSLTTPSTTAFTTVKYKKVDFIDTQGTGTKAFTMLIPSDWKAEGAITWILDNPLMPAVGEFRAWNPNGYEEFHLFPNQAFVQSNNPMFVQAFPLGSRYFGALVHDPLGPIDALKEIALPKFRSNVQNLRIVSEISLPSIANYFQTGTDPVTGVITSAEGGKIRVEYTLNGVNYEDELYCIIQSTDIPIPTIYGEARNINWYMTYIQSFRAEKGKLDSQSKTFQTIAYFARTDLNWLSKYNQVINYLVQKEIQEIQSLGQLSSIISQTSNEISDASYEAWKQNQQIKDKLADDFSHSILNIETYRNPIDSTTIDLPSGYSSVWTNNLGEYILSDSASYNPNIESNQNWYKMEKP